MVLSYFVCVTSGNSNWNGIKLYSYMTYITTLFTCNFVQFWYAEHWFVCQVKCCLTSWTHCCYVYCTMKY